MNILVASKNPVKINATKEAFAQVFPNQPLYVHGESVSSGVSDQPMSIKETRDGAQNRVDALQELNTNADYYVGIEGGIFEQDNRLQVMAILRVENAFGQTGEAMTATFEVPSGVAELVKSGMELGHANDQVFDKNNSKQKGGAIGLLTDDTVTRTDYYIHALVLALIPFKKPHLYE